MTDIALKSESISHISIVFVLFLAFSLSLPPWNVQDDGEGKRGDDIARKSCSRRVGPEAILSWATESLFLILMIKMVGTIRHEICQKFYTAGFSGQRFYTINFTEFQQF